jgi:hypothetical protein
VGQRASGRSNTTSTGSTDSSPSRRILTIRRRCGHREPLGLAGRQADRLHLGRRSVDRGDQRRQSKADHERRRRRGRLGARLTRSRGRPV